MLVAEGSGPLHVCGPARQCVRAAKEMDSKSSGLCPQGFESPCCRFAELPQEGTKAREQEEHAW